MESLDHSLSLLVCVQHKHVQSAVHALPYGVRTVVTH